MLLSSGISRRRGQVLDDLHEDFVEFEFARVHFDNAAVHKSLEYLVSNEAGRLLRMFQERSAERVDTRSSHLPTGRCLGPQIA